MKRVARPDIHTAEAADVAEAAEEAAAAAKALLARNLQQLDAERQRAALSGSYCRYLLLQVACTVFLVYRGFHWWQGQMRRVQARRACKRCSCDLAVPFACGRNLALPPCQGPGRSLRLPVQAVHVRCPPVGLLASANGMTLRGWAIAVADSRRRRT